MYQTKKDYGTKAKQKTVEQFLVREGIQTLLTFQMFNSRYA